VAGILGLGVMCEVVTNFIHSLRSSLQQTSYFGSIMYPEVKFRFSMSMY